jgi:hypothetical protein
MTNVTQLLSQLTGLTDRLARESGADPVRVAAGLESIRAAVVGGRHYAEMVADPPEVLAAKRYAQRQNEVTARQKAAEEADRKRQEAALNAASGALLGGR